MNEKQAQQAFRRFKAGLDRARSIFLVVRDEPHACYVLTATGDRTVAAQEIHREMTEGVAPHCVAWWWERDPGSNRRFIPPASARNHYGPIACPFSIREVKDGAAIMIGHAE